MTGTPSPVYPTHTSFIGLDLGQSADYTAVCVLEESVWITPEEAFELVAKRSGWVLPTELTHYQLDAIRTWPKQRRRPAPPPLSVRHLSRYPLGTPYPRIVADVRQLMDTPPLRPETTHLILDETGVGRPVADLFDAAGVRNVRVSITGGTTVSGHAGHLSVPKRDLVFSALAVLQERRLRIARAHPESATLVEELRNFKMKIDIQTGHDSYSAWRESQHDDLVLALCLATWYRAWWNQRYDARWRRHQTEEAATGTSRYGVPDLTRTEATTQRSRR